MLNVNVYLRYVLSFRQIFQLMFSMVTDSLPWEQCVHFVAVSCVYSPQAPIEGAYMRTHPVFHLFLCLFGPYSHTFCIYLSLPVLFRMFPMVFSFCVYVVRSLSVLSGCD